MDMFLDIETYARRTKALEDYHSGKAPSRRTVPRTYKDAAKIAAWEKAEDKRHSDELTEWVEQRESDILGAALVPTECGVACIGYALSYAPPQVLEGHTGEEEMLKKFEALVVEQSVSRIIGYNVVFDMACLTAAAARHGMWDLAGWLARVPYPESRTVNNAESLDLMPYAQGLVGMVKGMKRPVTHGGGLQDVSRLLKVKSVCADIDGADVPRAWEAGNFESIYDHCKLDVKRTQKLALKLKSAYALSV